MSAALRQTLVVGAGTTGLSVLRHLHGRDGLTLVDTRADIVPETVRADYVDVQFLLGGTDADLTAALDAKAFDRAVISPGLPERHWLLQYLQERGVPLGTDIDLFFAAVAESAAVIGVTGTNGKSTVTDLTATLLRAAGVDACAGGNLGPAALDLLPRQAEAYVLELSSFQLARSGQCPFTVATILNVQPDHLDYHGSMAGYLAAKQRIYAAAGQALYSRDDHQTAPAARAVEPVSFGLDAPASGQAGIIERDGHRWLAAGSRQVSAPVPIAPCAELTLAGSHNERNALAALALVLAVRPQLLTRVDGAAGTGLTALVQALQAYRGLPHRCEAVATINNVRYINDSKATNVGATVAAVAGLRPEHGGQLLLLLGGDGKGADFSALGAAVAQGVRAVFVYGAAAPELAALLAERVPTRRCRTLREALQLAHAAALPGDCIVLSPACASFDQFANFEARGDAFRAYVQELAA